MGHPDDEVEEAVELLTQLIDTADDAAMISEDEDGNRVELDLKTGEVTEEDDQ